MRRTVRPFIREFKKSSSKSPTRQPTPQGDEREAKPLLFDFPDAAVRHDKHDDGYEAALKAADAVFGKKIVEPAPPAPASAIESAPPPSAGRVLPSLIETPETPAGPRETVKQARKPRARRTEEAEKAEKPVAPARRRGRPPRQPKSEPPSVPVERPAAKIAADKIAAEAPKTSAPRRTRRPIQLRWVLRTELKAGEKWKRRLPKAAR